MWRRMVEVQPDSHAPYHSVQRSCRPIYVAHMESFGRGVAWVNSFFVGFERYEVRQTRITPRHGEDEANELRGVKRSLGPKHFKKHPDFPHNQDQGDCNHDTVTLHHVHVG